MRLLAMLMLASVLCGQLLGATRAKATEAKPRRETSAAVAAKLRGEWDMGTTRMMRLVVDDASFEPALKASLGDSIEKFLSEQDALLAQVEKDPSQEAAVRKKQAQLEADFAKKMQVVYSDANLQKEMARRMKALDKEIDEIAAGAEKLLASLDQVGLTKEQKAAITPAVREANAAVKAEVDKSETKSAKDKKNRDRVVKSYNQARKKIRQQLTAEQKEKLTKKLAGEG